MEKFNEWLLANYKNKNTAKSYYYTVKKFLQEYELTEENLNKYASLLVEKSKSTQNQFVKSINAYVKYKEIDIKVPKYCVVDQKEHNYITEEDLNKKLIPAVYNACTKADEIIPALKFLYYTGLRKDEFFRLKREDIDLKNQTAIVRGTKGKKDRKVHISKKIIKDLTAYFVTHIEKDNAFNMNNGKLSFIMKNINEQKPFKFNLHPHLFRHSCAKDMCRRGVSVAVIQKILGHKNIDTTMLYVDPDEGMIKEIYHKFMD